MKKLLNLLIVLSLLSSGVINTVTCGCSNNNRNHHNFTKVPGVNESDIITICTDSKSNIYYINNKGNAYELKKGAASSIKINGITKTVSNIAVDSNDNVYFGCSNPMITTTIGAYELKVDQDIAYEIKGIDAAITVIKIDHNGNIYFGGFYLYVLWANTASIVKIAATTEATIIKFDDDNVYFTGLISGGASVLQKGSNIAHNIPFQFRYSIYSIDIDVNNNIYFCTNDGLYILKDKGKTVNKISIIGDYRYFSVSILNNLIFLVVLNEINHHCELYLLVNKNSNWMMQIIIKAADTRTLISRKIISNIKNHDKNFYFYIGKEIYYISNKQIITKNFNPILIEKLDVGINIIYIDNNDNFYLGTEGTGILKYNKTA